MINLKEKLLGSWLGDKLLKEGRVAKVQALGARYRQITVSTSALHDAPVSAGDKLQFFLPGVGTRTYTPFGFQPEASSFQLLAFLHGRGPGSAWAQQLSAGDSVRFVGPQTSLPLAGMTPPVALFGDETSLAVARTLLDAHGQRCMAWLEVADMTSAREVAAHIGLPEQSLALRMADDDYRVLAERLATFAGSTGTIVLTGSAQNIQRLRAALRKGERKGPQKAKGYWSEGKTGLD